MKLSGTVLLFSALAVSPFVAAPLAAAGTTAATPAAAVSPEAVGVSAPKVIPAVLEKARLQGRVSELNAFTQAVENKLTDSLTRTRKFKVVSRADLDAVLAEQNLAASGNLDASDAQLAQRFKLAGVKSILLVTVDDFQDRIDSFTSEALGQTVTRRTIRAGANAKLIDTTTGVVKESVSIPPVTQDDIRGILSRLKTTADRTDAITPELARLVAERVAQRLVDSRFPAKVLAKSPDNIVTFNRGDGSGVVVGQEWGVYAVGEALVDPDTGESLGSEEVLIGRAVVTEVEAKFSKAKLLKDNGVDRGAVLRPITAGKDVKPKSEAPAAAEAPKPEPVKTAESTPAAVAAAAAPVVHLTLVVEGGANVLRLEGNIIAPADAKDTFARLALAKPGASVVLDADPAVPTESVTRVLKALGDAGFAKVELAKK